MGEGWETARRRDDGNDWVELRLAGPGVVRLAELDTSYFVGNAPGWASLRRPRRPDRGPTTRRPGSSCCRGPGSSPTPGTGSGWPDGPEVTQVRLDVYPDGGMARVRLHGELSDRRP